MKTGSRVQFCPKGHDTFICGRNKQWLCKQCDRENSAQYRTAHKEELRIKERIAAKRDKEKLRKRQRQWREDNKEKRRLQKKRYYERHKKIILAKQKEYNKLHPESLRTSRLKNKLERKQRVPKFGQKGIKAFIKNTPKGYVVDHILPLCGKKMSGLHVRWNLQYLTPKQNRKKWNRISLKKASAWYGEILEEMGLK